MIAVDPVLLGHRELRLPGCSWHDAAMVQDSTGTGVTALRALGAVLILAGLVLAIAPTLVHDPGPAADTFAAIERRIPWGALGGLGALLVARTQLKPWPVTLASFVLWGTVGILVARGIGLVLDGADSSRQWMWFGVEVAVIAVAAFYLWRKRAQPQPTLRP